MPAPTTAKRHRSGIIFPFRRVGSTTTSLVLTPHSPAHTRQIADRRPRHKDRSTPPAKGKSWVDEMGRLRRSAAPWCPIQRIPTSRSFPVDDFFLGERQRSSWTPDIMTRDLQTIPMITEAARDVIERAVALFLRSSRAGT